MRPLRERNQAAIGAIFLVILLAGTYVAFFAEDLFSGNRYTAVFRESAGIAADDDVRIAGVKVGEVSDVSLRGDRVDVQFSTDGSWLGERTGASIEIKTLLGDKYLALTPEGRGEQDPDAPIGLDRTRSPFDVTDALHELSRTADDIDSDQLARSFEVISDTFRNTPEHVQGTIDGLSRLSETISSRDEEFAALLANTRQFSGIAAERSEQVQKLFADGNQLLAELQIRDEAIHRLLRGTEDLGNQLRGVVGDNQEQLRPALQELDQVSSLLQRQQDNISQGIREMAPFIRVFNNTIGNGRWFDGYLCGIIPPPLLNELLTVNPEGCVPPNPDTGGGS
ncbi:MCE family protein [Saccharopolyspora sp. HNM0983]|uniref:MCE family protein n=1 Tax=Saccharopolyspora montiporae TaxID=2781240 RepID=A0A929FYT2_9PSEU|nr:MCE family protein [Saccharopolyspora sp. HNM0983]MBE9373805.1 MCE family protein [Saccharopolyspora sp. HNM0983]